MRTRLAVLLAVVAGMLSIASSHAQSWNCVSDYSWMSSPNGPWSYCRTWSQPAASVDRMTARWGATGWYVGNAWHPSLQAGVALWAADNSNGYPVVRWTCPTFGRYRISGYFEGADSRGVDVTARIAVNGVAQFTGHVNGPTARVPFAADGLVHSRDDAYSIATAGGGTIVYDLLVPGDVALLGTRYFLRASVVAPGRNPLGMVTSNGAAVRIGS